MKRSLIALLVGLIAFSASASTYPVAGNWADPNIWDKGYVPINTSSDEIKISTNIGVTVTVNTNVGTYTTAKIDTFADSTLYVTTGGFLGDAKEFHIGDAGASGTGTDIGYLVQDGGTIDIAGSGKMFIGYKTGGDGTYTISGGSLTASGENGRLYIGCGSSSGSIGKMVIQGTAPSISVDGLYVANASSSSEDDPGTGTVRFELDGGAVSKIISGSVAIDAVGTGTAALEVAGTGAPAGDVVLIQNTGTSSVAGAFDTINGVAAVEGALVNINGAIMQLTYQYDADGDLENNDIALVVPEPATMLLLGLGGLLIRRKK